MTNERLFFNSVYYVELEISSTCNRHCNYCPQSIIKRERELMPIETIEKVMKELKTINFRGGIAFHQFNEPLVELDHLIESIKCVRKYLPKARLVLYTNGDLLTYKNYCLLKKLGIDKFHITCHLGKNEIWDKDSAISRINKVKRKLHLVLGKYSYKDSSITYISSKIKRFLFTLQEYGIINLKKYPNLVQIDSIDFRKSCSSRLNTVDTKDQNEITERNCTWFCATLMHGMHISYKGNAYLCCDCCEDTDEANKFLLGSIYEESIFELFSKKLPFMQKYIEGNPPENCIGCYWNQ